MLIRRRKELSSRLSRKKPSVLVGKAGIEKTVEEVKRQLKSEGLVKIKLLKSAADGSDKEALAQKLAELTKAELIEVRGSTFGLWKKKKED